MKPQLDFRFTERMIPMSMTLRILFRIFLVLSLIFLVLAVLRYLEERRVNYIEIYNNEMGEDLFE